MPSLCFDFLTLLLQLRQQVIAQPPDNMHTSFVLHAPHPKAATIMLFIVSCSCGSRQSQQRILGSSALASSTAY
jgi:hypothetical protein